MSVTFTINKTLDGAQRHLHTYLVRQKAKGTHLHSIGIRLLAKWNEIAHELNTLPTAEIHIKWQKCASITGLNGFIFKKNNKILKRKKILVAI